MSLRSSFRDMRTIKQLLESAERHARGAGEPEPGPEHLLLAALDLPEGSARRAFARVGADPDGLAAAVEAHHAEALASVGVAAGGPAVVAAPPARGPYRSTGAAQETFQAAGRLARERGVPLGGAHVVETVAATEHGTAAAALARLGVDGAVLADAARAEGTTRR
jgi:ATP-dependent Clp protease ATP-binding subunit ClpA